MAKRNRELRLQIAPVIERASEIAKHVEAELPTHQGLSKAASGVLQAAENAERIAAKLRRALGIHQAPALFLMVSLIVFLGWGYWHFIHVAKLRIAISARDAVQLKLNIGERVAIVSVETEGSRDSLSLLANDEADLAFIQGGMEIPTELRTSQLESDELVLFFVREGIDKSTDIRKVMTSSKGQGSHTLLTKFAHIWRIEEQIECLHDWRELTSDPEYQIPENLDAIFVVKDPMNENVASSIPRIREAGFRLAEPDIGAMALRLPYLSDQEIRPGFLDPGTGTPEDVVHSYSVATYLVARPQLTPRQMAAASKLQARVTDGIGASAFEPTLDNAGEFAQGVEAIVSLLVYVGLAFLALLGLDIMTYRKYFNELNTLVSLISMHQSSKDAAIHDGATQEHNIEYLKVCSDLLGLISVITGYYAQENPSLLYNRLPEIIHDRCDALKINIQLKILQGVTCMRSDNMNPVAIDAEETVASGAPADEADTSSSTT